MSSAMSPSPVCFLVSIWGLDFGMAHQLGKDTWHEVPMLGRAMRRHMPFVFKDVRGSSRTAIPCAKYLHANASSEVWRRNCTINQETKEPNVAGPSSWAITCVFLCTPREIGNTRHENKWGPHAQDRMKSTAFANKLKGSSASISEARMTNLLMSDCSERRETRLSAAFAPS